FAAALLATLLLAVAYAAAVVQSRSFAPPPHDFDSFLSANTLAATIVLAIVAFVLFILQRSGAPLSGWLSFWTFTFIAFLIHLVARRAGASGTLSWVGAIVAAWWGIDLVLAWTAGATSGPARVARGVLHVAVFVLLLARSLGSQVWYLHALGVLMVLAVLAA